MGLFVHSHNVEILGNPARLVTVVFNSYCKVYRDPGNQNARDNAVTSSVAP
jgi:hypothetical protein